MNSIKLFESKNIRSIWNEAEENGILYKTNYSCSPPGFYKSHNVFF